MHLTQGLELLPSLPESPARIQHELDLQIALGHALIVLKGQAAPEAAQAFTRARALCEQLEETPQLFEALAGLRMIHEARGELLKARELAEQLLSLAQRQQDPAHLMRAHRVLGGTLFHLGAFAPARASLEQGIVLDTLPRDRSAAIRLSDYIQGGSILGVSCRRDVALTLWYLGYPEQARQQSDEAITRAHELAHSYSLAYALYFATVLHCLRLEAPAAQAQAEALMELARQREFPARGVRGTVLWGWALAAQGQSTEGIAQMRQGMDAHRSMGAMMRPYDLALLAAAYGWIEQTAEALRLLDEALALTHHFGGHFYQAEVYRLTGKLLLMQHAGGGVSGSPPPGLSMVDGHEGEVTGQLPRPTEAEPWFRQALDIARQQQAKSLELRAATSLSRLWQRQGRRTDAYQLLAPIYGWFTEGSTPPICRRPRLCWRRYPDLTATTSAIHQPSGRAVSATPSRCGEAPTSRRAFARGRALASAGGDHRLQDEFLLRRAAPDSTQKQARFREAKAFLDGLEPHPMLAAGEVSLWSMKSP
jgi:tetratricopeptide (TPR) repeat protein